MLNRIATYLTLSALLAAPAAAARSLTPVPLAGQEVVWESGVPFTVSRLGSTTVALSPVEIERKHAWIVITVINEGDRPITIYDGGVTAEESSGAHLRVHAYEALAKREKRRRFWENVGLGLAAAAQGYSAGQAGRSTSYYSGTVSAYGSGGYARGNYSGTVTTYDAAAAHRAHADAIEQTKALADRIERERQARQEALSSEILRTQTIAPGERHAGRLQIDLPRSAREPQPVTVYVNASNDRHAFVAFVDGQPSHAQISMVQQRHARVVTVPERAAPPPGHQASVPAPTANEYTPAPAASAAAPGQPVTTPAATAPSSAAPLPAAQPMHANLSIATEERWVNPTVTEMKVGWEDGTEVVMLRVTFLTAGSGAAPAGRLYVGTREQTQFVLDLPLSERQLARGRFGEHLTFPVSELPPQAQAWIRQATLPQVHATYR